MEMTAQQWSRTLEVNTTGSFLCAQAAAKHMREQGSGGSIVFTASISAHRVNFPQPQAGYNVSKAAIVALKNSLAAEWARYVAPFPLFFFCFLELFVLVVRNADNRLDMVSESTR